ncbi:MAG: GTP 3',8-cyclase MoaA [Desulfobulbaceae bacterium]|nr:GTP 3',8-cyclase MoaA [Desulfobulbaceae bacterium]
MTAHHRGTSIPRALPHQSPDLIDNHGRRITYLRLAITDRCNLRCRYCRPEAGVPFIPHAEILTFEELERLVCIFSSLGVSKVRVTGGEPFSRRGSLDFLRRLAQIAGVSQLHVTTNGVKTARYLEALRELGLSGMNLSLDTLDRKRFWKITRRDYLEPVLETLHGALARAIPLKINSVVLADTSDAEIRQLAEIPRQYPVALRFIERMPFSGGVRQEALGNADLVRRLENIFPTLSADTTTQPTTARLFTVPGFVGKLGVIAGYSRHFCQSCDKLRITPPGLLKTCLYDNGVLDLKALLRQGATDSEIKREVIACVNNRFRNGHAAEEFCNRTTEPAMSRIGG